MMRIITLLVALTLLVGPIGAIAHALETDSIAIKESTVMTPAPAEGAERRCCQNFIHIAKSACHLDPGLVRALTPRAPREVAGVTFDTASLVPTSADMLGLFRPPRPA